MRAFVSLMTRNPFNQHIPTFLAKPLDFGSQNGCFNIKIRRNGLDTYSNQTQTSMWSKYQSHRSNLKLDKQITNQNVQTTGVGDHCHNKRWYRCTAGIAPFPDLRNIPIGHLFWWDIHDKIYIWDFRFKYRLGRIKLILCIVYISITYHLSL